MNLGQFDRQARRAAEQVAAEATETIRAVALDLYSEVQKESDDVSGSPRASGRLAASTRLEINEIDPTFEAEDPNYDYPSAEIHKYDRDNLPARTIRNRPISRISAKLRRFRLGDTIFVSNSVPYIRRIEIAGHSWQTPDGVFERSARVVVARFSNIRLRVRRV